MGRCVVCGRTVVAAPGDLRTGPRGFLRCTEHEGEPLPARIREQIEDELEPEADEDFYEAVEKEFRFHYNVEVVVRAQVFRVSEEPVEGEEDPSEKAWDKLTAGEIADAHELHRESPREVGDTEKVKVDGSEFDEDEWREEKLRDEFGDLLPPEGERVEEKLEVFM